jgi:hypothetical protein
MAARRKWSTVQGGTLYDDGKSGGSPMHPRPFVMKINGTRATADKLTAPATADEGSPPSVPNPRGLQWVADMDECQSRNWWGRWNGDRWELVTRETPGAVEDLARLGSVRRGEGGETDGSWQKLLDEKFHREWMVRAGKWWSVMSALWVGWILVALVGFALFQLHPNGMAKRRGYPLFVVGMAMLFLASTWLALPPLLAGLIMIVTVLLVGWTLIATRFCVHCGRLVSLLMPWAPHSACPFCGVALVPNP